MRRQLCCVAVLVGLSLVLGGPGAFAQGQKNDRSHDPKIVERLHHQQQRIDNGVKKGLLTKDEAALVQDNLDRIKAEEEELKAAGKLTVKEKKRLHHKLDLNSTMIKKEKKNAIRYIE